MIFGGVLDSYVPHHLTLVFFVLIIYRLKRFLFYYFSILFFFSLFLSRVDVVSFHSISLQFISSIPHVDSFKMIIPNKKKDTESVENRIKKKRNSKSKRNAKITYISVFEKAKNGRFWNLTGLFCSLAGAGRMVCVCVSK